MGLSQGDLLDHGGPSRETVRQVELGNRDNYRSATFAQLDRALGWPTGTADSVRDGEMDADTAVSLPARVAAAATLVSGSTVNANADTPEPPADVDDLVSLMTTVVRELTELHNPTPRQQTARHHASLALRELLVEAGVLEPGQLLPADTGRPPGAEPLATRRGFTMPRGAKIIRVPPSRRSSLRRPR